MNIKTEQVKKWFILFGADGGDLLALFEGEPFEFLGRLSCFQNTNSRSFLCLESIPAHLYSSH
jgi:hypothetical protein